MNNLFEKRRSNRFLSNKPLKEEEKQSILRAGELAPIALGKYGDIILNIFEGEELEKLKKVYKETLNRDIYYDGSFFVLVTQKDAPIQLSNQNAGAIIENMLLEATELNIGSVFIFQPVRGALEYPNLMKALKVEEGYTPISGAIFGYKTSEEVRPLIHEIKKNYINNK